MPGVNTIPVSAKDTADSEFEWVGWTRNGKVNWLLIRLLAYLLSYSGGVPQTLCQTNPDNLNIAATGRDDPCSHKLTSSIQIGQGMPLSYTLEISCLSLPDPSLSVCIGSIDTRKYFSSYSSVISELYHRVNSYQGAIPLLLWGKQFGAASEARSLIYYLIAVFSSVQFSRSVMSDSLKSHEPQHTRPPRPSPTPGVHSNSCPLSQWCHPAISSSVVPFSSYSQSLPASESFPMSQLFTWGGQSTGVSALASFLPKNTQDWSPLEWTGWISLQSKGLSRVFSNTTVQKHQFFGAQLSSPSNSHIHTWPQEKP